MGNRNYFDYVVLLFIWGTATSGLVKYVGLVIGFPYVHLMPKGILLVAALIPLLLSKFSRRQFAVLIFLSLWGAYSVHRNGVPQTLMGFWVLLPFFFGMMFPTVVLSEVVKRGLLYVFLVSLAFELINYLTPFPWESMVIDYGDYSSTVGRAWTDNGARRLAGLSSSSIDLSLVLALSSLFMASRIRSSAWKVVIVSLSFFAIYLTTMKTAAAAYLLAAVPLIWGRRPVRISWFWGAVFATLAGTLLPVYVYSEPDAARALVDGFLTLQARLHVVWPAVIDYTLRSSPGLLGLGMGGLGAAMQVGGQAMPYGFVDNMYLYVVACGGLLGVAFIFLLWRALHRLCTRNAADYSLAGGGALVFIVIYGVTQVSFEASMSSLFLGALVGGHAFSRKERQLKLGVSPQ